MAFKDGFGAWGLELRPADKTAGLEIRLAPAGELEGRVLDKADQKPIGRAMVRFHSVTRTQGQNSERLRVQVWPEIFTTLTHPEGWFHFGGLPQDGEVFLEVRPEGYTALSSTVKVGDRHVEISVSRGGGIVGGVVREDTGEPLRGVSVRCTREPQPDSPYNLGFVPSYAKSDEHGCFTLDGLRAGNYWVCVLDGRALLVEVVAAPKRVEKVEEGKESVCEDIVLSKGGWVKGKVTDRGTGAGVANVPVQATLVVPGGHIPYGYGTIPNTRTSADGTYKLHLAPGKWRVEVSPASSYYASRDPSRSHVEVEVASGKTLEEVNLIGKGPGASAGIAPLILGF